MTATHVNGRQVIGAEPAESPLSTPERPIHFKQIIKLLLADGAEMFGCVHCDYTAERIGSVRPHLVSHSNGKPRSRSKAPAPADLSLADLLGKVADLERVTAERDEWKRRAMKAERSMAALRKALRP